MYFLQDSDLIDILIELEKLVPDVDMNLVIKLRAETTKIDNVEFEEYGSDLRQLSNDEQILSGNLCEQYLQWIAFCDSEDIQTDCELTCVREHFSSFLGLDTVIDYVLMAELEKEYRETVSY